MGEQKLFVELSKETPPTPIGKTQRNRSKSSIKNPLVRSLYTISIRTADVNQPQTPDNVEMIIRGSDREISKIRLKDYTKEEQQACFQRGNLDQFDIEHEYIGKVRSYSTHTCILVLLDREYHHWFQ